MGDGRHGYISRQLLLALNRWLLNCLTSNVCLPRLLYRRKSRCKGYGVDHGATDSHSCSNTSNGARRQNHLLMLQYRGLLLLWNDVLVY